jgi:hypothetical protein
MRRIKRVLASTAALTLLMHDFAWAVCSDGSTLPAGGFVVGVPPIQSAANWSPNVFTGTTGSVWIPDTSVNEHNDPTRPLTGGGHNWVFDQGSTLCKVTDVGPAGALATSWQIPPNNPTDCVILPVIKNGQVTNLGDIPYQGNAITPTCDPTLLSTPSFANPNNTYFNQLGCSISHGVATTPATTTSYLFVAGIKGGMFSITLDNVGAASPGGEAGKTVGPANYYAQIPEGSLLTNAAVSNDGQFAVVTSLRRDIRVWGCLNPLGDPGDPGLPIDPNFTVAQGSAVSCMQVGFNNLQTDLTTAFGPDNQPYFGGQRVVTTYDAVPGGNFSTAWPNCIWQGAGAASLQDAFTNGFLDGCGDAQANFGFTSALITQPPAIISHGNYMYVGPVGGNVVQFAVTVDPFDGTSKYQFRTYVTGLSILTGLGIAGDLQSLMIYTDPTTLGLASQEVVTRLPLCEDMLGEQTVAGGSGTTTTGGGSTTGSTTGTTTGTTTSTANSTVPAIGFTTPFTAAAAATTPITGGIVGGIAAPASTGTPATTAGGVGGVGGTSNGAGANSPSTAKGGAATGGAATNPAAGATIAGTPVPTGTPGLFAAAGQDPSGPMTAKVTLISRAGMPRIAFDSMPVAIPSFVAARSTTPAVPTALDATASIGPGTAPAKSLTSNTKTKSRASTGVRPNGKLVFSAASASTR